MMRLCLVLLLLISGIYPAKAEEAPVDSAAPSVLARLEEKLRQHPEIAAYASRVEASSNYAKGELGLPDPMLFIEQEDYRFSSDRGRGGGDTMLGFQQEIPRYRLRESRAGKIRAESRKNQLLQDYAFAAMKARMITALADLQKVKELRAIAQEQEKLLKTQQQSLEGSLTANRVAFSMLPMTDAELQEINITLAELEEERHGIEAMLINMLDEVPDLNLPPIEMAAWNDDPAQTYPVAVALSGIEMAKQEVGLREAEYGPNFSVRASAGRMDGGDEGGTLMLGLSIPLWASENQKPKLQGAKANLSAAEFDRDAVKREMLEKLMHLKAQVDTSAKKIELLAHKESLTKAAADAASREYEAGKGDFASILKIRRDAYSVQSQVAMERAKHTALIADFNRYILEGEQP